MFNLKQFKRLETVKSSRSLVNEPCESIEAHDVQHSKMLKELLREDLDTLTAVPYNPDLRLALLKKTLRTDSPELSKDELRQFWSSLRDNFGAVNKDLSNSISGHLDQKRVLSEQIATLPPRPIYPLNSIKSYSDLLLKLKPYFEQVSAELFEYLCRFVGKFESVALVLFEPYLWMFLGTPLFLSIFIPLHVSGSFVTLLKDIQSILHKYSIPRSVQRISLAISQYVSNRPLFLGAISSVTLTAVGALIPTLLAGNPVRGNDWLNALNSLPAPGRLPEPLHSVLAITKDSLEASGAEIFKVSTAFFRGALLSAVDSMKEPLNHVIKAITSK